MRSEWLVVRRSGELEATKARGMDASVMASRSWVKRALNEPESLVRQHHRCSRARGVI
jgi:hypothetical protein